MLFFRRPRADFQHSGWRFLGLWARKVSQSVEPSNPASSIPGQHGAQSIDGSIIGGELEFVSEE